jgi:protease IV
MDLDTLLDRRRLKRRLTFWRISAIIAVAALIIFAVGKFDSFGGSDHIAVLDVSNIIVDDPDRSEALSRVAKDKSIKALVVHIDSPGGTVVGGEALYLHLRKVAEAKPVVAVMSDLATSAGYMTAIAADRIFARRSTVTGSIGVIMQTTDITGLLGKIGIKPEAIKSAPLKAQPNPLEPMTAKTRAAAQAVVTDMFDMFVEMVVERRKMTKSKVTRLADGRVYTGRQALQNGLIDAIGGENEALDWLEETKNISRKLPLKDVKIRRDDSFVGKTLDRFFGKTLFSERLRLDGLISLWHPNLQ